jgi:hypothetical protein
MEFDVADDLRQSSGGKLGLVEVRFKDTTV